MVVDEHVHHSQDGTLKLTTLETRDVEIDFRFVIVTIAFPHLRSDVR